METQFQWLEWLIGSSSTAGPHPSRRMKRLTNRWGAVPSHTGEIGPHPWFRNPPNLYSPSNAGTITTVSRVDIPPRTACQPRLHWLNSRDWLVGFDPISSQLFRPSRVFSHTSRMRRTFEMRAQFNELFA